MYQICNIFEFNKEIYTQFCIFTLLYIKRSLAKEIKEKGKNLDLHLQQNLLLATYWLENM